jgi:hypothetical protein
MAERGKTLAVIMLNLVAGSIREYGVYNQKIERYVYYTGVY